MERGRWVGSGATPSGCGGKRASQRKGSSTSREGLVGSTRHSRSMYSFSAACSAPARDGPASAALQPARGKAPPRLPGGHLALVDRVQRFRVFGEDHACTGPPHLSLQAGRDCLLAIPIARLAGDRARRAGAAPCIVACGRKSSCTTMGGSCREQPAASEHRPILSGTLDAARRWGESRFVWGKWPGRGPALLRRQVATQRQRPGRQQPGVRPHSLLLDTARTPAAARGPG